MPILVVDDDRDSREVLVEYLRVQGRKALGVGSGDDALLMARQARPRAIVLDLLMPGISGLDVLRALKTDEVTRGIPVLCLSGFSPGASKADSLGADDFLLKPTSPKLLLERIDELIRLMGPR